MTAIAEQPGDQLPSIRVRPPGPSSRSWLVRAAHAHAPMGPKSAAGTPALGIVFATARGANVIDVDGNRYVDLAAGFGSLLVGHRHPDVTRALALQSDRLWQAMGDLYAADARIALCERVAELMPMDAQVILGQSGSDAVSAALKTALLHTGKPGVVAFHGSYHGLGYGPLAVGDLRASYRDPFAPQLNPHVRFATYPGDDAALARSLSEVAAALAPGDVGAIVVEPILGRGGVIVPPRGFVGELARRARDAGALLVADEIWTGLGRSGRLFASLAADADSDAIPDLICLGKGLGGGLPVSVCAGRRDVMASWSRAEEVVHTSTFAGAPAACSTAVATLGVLERDGLVARSERLGASWLDALRERLAGAASVRGVRGTGLMIGIELDGPGAASAAMFELLRQGWITSTGGGRREVLVLTPPLTVAEPLLDAFTDVIGRALGART